MMPTKGKQIWFPAKRYGWGWGLPCAWQGWVVLVVWLGLLFRAAWLTIPGHIKLWIASVVVLAAALIVIGFIKGEKPRWRWGDGGKGRGRKSRLVAHRANGYNGVVKLDRQAITKSMLREHVDDNYVPGTIEERVLMVWPITREVASLSPQHDVERRLQRHVVRVGRRER
jgi:hypothetical protein